MRLLVLSLALSLFPSACKRPDADAWSNETFGAAEAKKAREESSIAYQRVRYPAGGMRTTDDACLTRPFLLFRAPPPTEDSHRMRFHRLMPKLGGAATSPATAHGYAVVEYQNEVTKREVTWVRKAGRYVQTLEYRELMFVVLVDREGKHGRAIAVATHDDDALVEALGALPDCKPTD